jgi:aquaporin Z
MFAKALVELIGTFVFLSVILSQGQAIPIAIALATAIYFGGSVSGGHFNPAVTIMQTVGGKIDIMTAVVYIFAQVIAGIAAFGFARYVIAN